VYKNSIEWQEWLENNQHKLIFYSYRGGAGGEFIGNHVGSNEYFYNSDLLKSFKNDEVVSNESLLGNPSTANFKDIMLCEFFFLESSYGDRKLNSIEDLGDAMNKYWISNYYSISHHYQEEFSKQDKPYFIPIHRVFDWIPKLLPKAKIIIQVPEDWVYYINLLGKCKISSAWHKFLEIGPKERNYIKLLKENYPEWCSEKSLYSFEEMFSGEWVEKEFGINGESFSKAYHEWDKKNIEYLKILGQEDFMERPKKNLPTYVQST